MPLTEDHRRRLNRSSSTPSDMFYVSHHSTDGVRDRKACVTFALYVFKMKGTTLMTQNHQRYQGNQQNSFSRPHDGHHPPPGNAQDQSREFLWRERVRLELQVQAILARGDSLARQWQHLQERKAALGDHLPTLASQMIISGLIGIRQLPAERLHLYEKGRIAQDQNFVQNSATQVARMSLSRRG